MAYIKKEKEIIDCSTCEYHSCTNTCFKNSRHCDGICLKEKIRKCCFKTKKCKSYRYDLIFERVKESLNLC